MGKNNQLVTIENISIDNAPAIFVEGGLKPFIDRVREEVAAEVPDISTRKGRERIASLAAKVSKSKTAVEKPGRDYLRHLKAQPKVVETELREFVQAMDALRDETRKPLTEWEDAEKARVAKHEAAIHQIKLRMECYDLDSAELKSNIEWLEGLPVDGSWEEFEAEAHRAKGESLNSLRVALAKREQHEAEQAELEELRRKQAEQEQKDREARIAQEAADKARADAERAAKAELEAAAKREADAKANADALQRRIKEQEEAAQAERQRIADEKAKEEAEAEARERNNKHKAAVNNEALKAFMEGSMPEDCARLAVVLIAKGLIPNIRITY